MRKIRAFVKEYKPELQIVFWPAIIFTAVTFAIYFYYFWNVEATEDKKKKRSAEGPTRDEKEALQKLYSDGQRYEAAGDPKQALSCYLGCIHSINTCYDGLSAFPDILIDCIKRVTELCKASGEYDMALQFLQAEKFLYEHALVNETKKGSAKLSNAPKDSPVKKRKKPYRKEEFYSARADALEKLSDLLLKEGKTELAVSYASKALQVRQKVSDDEAAADMNQFIKAYAELGRETYRQNLSWYQKVQEDTEALEKMVEQQMEAAGLSSVTPSTTSKVKSE